MKYLHCLRTKKNEYLSDNIIKNLCEEIKYEVKFMDFQNSHKLNNEPLIIIVDSDSIEHTLEILSIRSSKVIIAFQERKDFKLLSLLKGELQNIFGFLDLSQEVEYNTPLLLNYLNLNFTQNTIQLEKLANDVEKIFEHTRSELFKVKNLHDRLVKIRVDKLKGLTLTSKFMAGEKSGGEFFDVINRESDVILLQVGSDSYMATSLIMSALEEFKLNLNQEDFRIVSEKILNKLQDIGIENKAEISFCSMKLNLKNLQATFIKKGLGKIILNNEEIELSSPKTIKLKPNEKVAFVSQGTVKNWSLLNPSVNLLEKIKLSEDLSLKDTLNDFYFELSRNKIGSFLVYDAFSFVAEIESGTLYDLN